MDQTNTENVATTVPTSLSNESYLHNIPMWVIDWYYTHSMHMETVTLIKNFPATHTKNELNVANIMVEDFFNEKCKINKRAAPKAEKICSICEKKVTVNSAKQFCIRADCNGKLNLIVKAKREARRKPPKCKKKCFKCSKTFDCVATALQKCKICGEKIYILK